MGTSLSSNNHLLINQQETNYGNSQQYRTKRVLNQTAKIRTLQYVNDFQESWWIFTLPLFWSLEVLKKLKGLESMLRPKNSGSAKIPQVTNPQSALMPYFFCKISLIVFLNQVLDSKIKSFTQKYLLL